jgi:hypothetical protein
MGAVECIYAEMNQPLSEAFRSNLFQTLSILKAQILDLPSLRFSYQTFCVHFLAYFISLPFIWPL